MSDSFPLFAVASALLLSSCASPVENQPAGADCVRSLQCAAGLACIEGVCSDDPSSIGGMVPRPEDAAVADAAIDEDATVADAGDVDAAIVDAGEVDAAMADAGPIDAGTDAGMMDSSIDAGPTDAGIDGGPMDAGIDGGPTAGIDAGPEDAGIDAGSMEMDAGVDASMM